MGRQAGVYSARVSARRGTVALDLEGPQTIEFAELHRTCYRGGFTPTSMRLIARGTVRQEECETCATERPFLVLDSTGQRLELEGEPDPLPEGGVVRGALVEWTSEHPRIRLE